MHDDDIDDSIAAVTYDEGDDSVVAIVGSGAGGGTLANELSQKGIDVVLIDDASTKVLGVTSCYAAATAAFH